MPVSIGVQWPDIETARSCGRGDLQLAYCNSCGFIWNRSFDESRLEYSQKYDNSLDFSPVFQSYAEGLADRLIETYSIRGKRVVELGCGKGHFLSLLCERGENTGIGFDPSYEGERVDSAVAERIEYVQDFYGEKYTDHPGDLVCCRHVLEHIKNPFDFLASVRKTVGGNTDTIVYFEVPNVRLILERLSVWDIIYEHCNYFSRESLVNLFGSAGFEVLRIEETYEKQFLSIDCRLSSEGASSQATPEPLNDLSGLVDRFSTEMKERIGSWHARLEEFEKAGKKVAIWGAGAKTVGFVNMLQIGDRIPIAVDINPHKQGLHLAGMGQKIVSPVQLQSEKPDVVIVMNPIYSGEIKSQLDSMGLTPEIIEA
ncbi:methyltransferase domain-containing protein [Pelagicoccus sp. NFK12]|uniref:Methyltransferase domain-containing protein n=1 Tax=Pelagicoccus enzymogenes TaxID=2773457 RepID=A0A927FCD4_9BACT|nr:class I SAM-dependent methyltransferase [Pelagicoccus enzymogenes]MBD5781191.1 methyltransferase domain-containing protein [Pelagicoccus enzymogenes]